MRRTPTPATKREGRCCEWLRARTVTLAGLGVLVVALDWVTKRAVQESMPYGSSEAVLSGFFNLVHVRNTGIAFSLFADSAPWFRDIVLPAVSFAVIGLVALMYRRLGEIAGTSRVALALVLAGAIGNLWERLLRGYVTDFLDFHVGAYHWPAFNVADSAITVGVVLLLLDSMLGRQPEGEAASAA